MCIKYSNEKVFEVSKDEELDARIEFIRQRQFLEQSITSLKKRVNTCVKKSDTYNKIMEENMVLIEENNKLRQELKINCSKKYDIESNFKIKSSKTHIITKQIKNNNAYQKSVASAKSIENQYKEHNINVDKNNTQDIKQKL